MPCCFIPTENLSSGASRDGPFTVPTTVPEPSSSAWRCGLATISNSSATGACKVSRPADLVGTGIDNGDRHISNLGARPRPPASSLDADPADPGPARPRWVPLDGTIATEEPGHGTDDVVGVGQMG